MPEIMFSWCFKWYRFGTDDMFHQQEQIKAKHSRTPNGTTYWWNNSVHWFFSIYCSIGISNIWSISFWFSGLFSTDSSLSTIWYQFQNNFKQYNLCAGTIIGQSWILTSAKCCKRDDIVTITFNDYSIFYADNNQNEIISTTFYIHQDLDACLIRTTDISNIVTHIPCLNKVKFQPFYHCG